jgi:AcrR family transcriptional regulator
MAPPRSTRQEQILDALEERFMAEGLDVTVGALARQARCSRRTLYEIAPSKERLFVLVLARLAERVGREARAAAAAHTTHADAVQGYMTAWQPWLRRRSPSFMRALETHPPAGRVYRDAERRSRADLAGLVSAGSDAGAFGTHDPSLVSDVLIAAVPHDNGVELVLSGVRAR